MNVIGRPLSTFFIGFWQLKNELATTMVLAYRVVIASHRRRHPINEATLIIFLPVIC
jgi:hypothetical protein